MAFAATGLPVWSCRSSPTPPKQREGRFRHLSQVVRKDGEFIKKRFDGFKTLHPPKLSKFVSDLFWLRNLEDPNADPGPPIQPPTPSYPGLSGMDLLMADIKALKEYAIYVYYVSRIWSRPLPEVYDPQKVTEYFFCRPHVVAFRLLEVFSTFASATIKMRASENLKFSGFGTHRDHEGKSSDYYIGQLLKETMLKLGPTFIKVGQSLSTRPDIIGSEISKALSELHEQIPPFPRATAMKIIEEELGCPADMAFSFISDEPVAAASFGQVYRGCTSDGYSVAIKVQRPNLHHAVALDIYILRLGLQLVKKIAKRKNDLRLYADELGRGLLGELDYSLEAANACEFSEAHARFSLMYVPRVFSHLSRKRVLTMEWLCGENPNELLLLSQVSDSVGHLENQRLEAKKHLLDLVNKGVEATLVQLLETGLLHADPHPGNLRYTPAGQIGFLDFGLLCRMKKKHQFAMLASIVHIVNGDWRALVYDLKKMDVVRPGTNIPCVTMELEDSLGEITFKDGIPDVKFSKVLSKIWSLAIKYHFRMPPYYTLLLRSLASLEGLAVAADRDFKTFQAAYPYVVRKLLTDNSPATRRILHSVVFNKRKEFKWQELALFLRIGAKRKPMHELFRSDYGSHSGHVISEPNGILQVASLVLRLLSSKDGAVLRRLLMTVEPKSLVQAMVCKEAIVFRQQLSRALADVLHQWMIKTFGRDHEIARPCSSHMKVTNVQNPKEMALSLESPTFSYQVALQDRRVKVIIYRILNAVWRDPLLMLRFCLVSIVIFLSASALACHRFLVSWSEILISNLSFAPWRIAVKV